MCVLKKTPYVYAYTHKLVVGLCPDTQFYLHICCPL